jgi:hypothetical protein
MANYSKSLGGILAASAVGAGLIFGVGTATAAPKTGHLVLDNAGVVQTLPPGQAKKQALAACGELAPTELDVDTVRAAFPGAFEVCPGVTLTSQVALEVDEVE